MYSYLKTNKQFFQTKNTAMGTKFLHGYANLTMSYLESKVFHPDTLFGINNILYQRYIDDPIIIWNGEAIKIAKFVDSFNHNGRRPYLHS